MSYFKKYLDPYFRFIFAVAVSWINYKFHFSSFSNNLHFVSALEDNVQYLLSAYILACRLFEHIVEGVT